MRRTIARLFAWVGMTLACGGSPETEVVALVAQDFDARQASGTWIEARSLDPLHPSDIALRARAGVMLSAPWRVFDLHRGHGGEPFASLLLSSESSLLAYHVAGQPGAIGGDDLLTSRLATITSEEGRSDAKLGLLFEPPLPRDRDAFVGLAELDDEDVARLVSLSLVVGADRALAADRFFRGADGRPRLPFFVPGEPVNGSRLAGSMLEVFLPPVLGHRLASEPQLREAVYAGIHRRARAAPELAAKIAERAESLGALAPDVTGLSERLTSRATALEGYLGSVWIEQLVRVEGADEARVTLFVHSVAPLDLAAFEAAAPDGPVEGLALVDPETAARHPAAGEGDGVRFAVGRSLDPVLDPARGFQSQRLDYRLTGLARFGSEPWKWIDTFGPRVRNRVTGALVPADHITGFASLRDPRFSSRDEEGVEAFAAALPDRLTRRDGAEPARVERAQRRVRVPAGVVLVEQDLVLPDGFGLVLEAGAELWMTPGRSILVRGNLKVQGEPGRPVLVRSAVPERSWGVLAVQGFQKSFPPGRSERVRAEIRYLDLIGGSSDDLRGAHYGGSLSIHHADLRLEHASLRDASADALSVKYGSVEIADTAFLDNQGDGADLDWSEGSVQRSTFRGGGDRGDGLELSDSRVSVEDSVFHASGRRCLSVSARARARVTGCLFRSCPLAVAARDGARVDLSDSVLLDNEREFEADRGAGVFGGGAILCDGLIRVGERSPDRRDGASEIEIRASLDPGPEAARAARQTLVRAARFSSESYRAMRAELP